MLLLPYRTPSAQPSILQPVQPSLGVPLPSSHFSVPLTMLSPQKLATHWPLLHTLLVSQVVPLATLLCPHPAAALVQTSVVHGLPSSQASVPAQVPEPALQTSPVVQALPSLQLLVLPVWVQPVEALQPSVVQTWLSSQLSALPATQVPLALHASFWVHTLLSALQVVPWLTGVNTQLPLEGSQASLVHTLPSLQVVVVPATQPPLAQLSPTVQAFPSLQLAVLLVCWQPRIASQESSVQG